MPKLSKVDVIPPVAMLTADEKASLFRRLMTKWVLTPAEKKEFERLTGVPYPYSVTIKLGIAIEFYFSTFKSFLKFLLGQRA